MPAKLLVASALLGLSSATLYPGLSNLNHTCAIEKPILSCSSGASNHSAVDTWWVP